jgi:UDP-N-acetylmuramoyl-tripeptide--D-alanyl-D-alanine ligase
MSAEDLHRLFLECSGACTDTRQLLRNGMFFALKGPTFNANSFAAEALEQGCRYAVVDDPGVSGSDRHVVVPDVLKALQDLGRHHRRQFQIPIIAITGTNGKTTTKELVHAVLNAKAPTLATSGNLNNHIGVPLTLLRISNGHSVAVIEMGANHVGEIAVLSAIAEPTHGLITNIGKAHLEGFGSFEGVVAAKTELYDRLVRSKGTAFVNAGDTLLMEKSAGIARITYGTTDLSATRGEAVHKGPFLSFWFDGKDGERHEVDTQMIGGYNFPNALAAVCIGQHFDVPDAAIAEALAAYAPGNNRSQFIDTGRNHVVMDAYNANPTSMRPP